MQKIVKEMISLFYLFIYLFIYLYFFFKYTTERIASAIFAKNKEM